MNQLQMCIEKRFIIIGAHPDDPDQMFGGAAVILASAGHKVKFVSTTNGNAGHHCMKPDDLAERRRLEALASAKVSGLVEYQVLDNPDGCLDVSLKGREQIVKILRKFKPDVVISHRVNDYHPDHRATAQLVQDASFLVMVPLYCPNIPIPKIWPVFAFSWDHFQNPTPFKADAFVAIDDVLEQKLAMLDCHKSQFYEWLPWVEGHKNFDVASMTEEEKRQWLLENWISSNKKQAKSYPTSAQADYIETFEQSEYGRQVSQEQFKALFKS